MTKDDFQVEMDKLVLEGINTIGAGSVLATLAVVSRFTEVVFDMSTVDMLQRNAAAQSQAKQQEAEVVTDNATGK